jgi:hypothetical protein
LKLCRQTWVSGVGLEAKADKTPRKNADQYKTCSAPITAEQKSGVLFLREFGQ